MKLRVGIVFGGKSSEHTVSILSAISIIKAIDKAKYSIIPISISKDGFLLSQKETYRMLSSEGYFPEKKTKVDFPYDELKIGLVNKQYRKQLPLDLIFPVLHGPNGEDGTVQGALELMGLPYVGNKVLGSAVSMDKDIMKKIVHFHNIPILPFVTIHRKDFEDNNNKLLLSIEKIAKDLSYPLFTKPANMGSSVGVNKVSVEDELMDAIEASFKYDDKIIVEEGINKARELEIGLLRGKDNNIELSAIGEIIPANDFYDYDAKYKSSNSKLVIPAIIDEHTKKKIEKLAKEAFDVLECSSLGRADFFIDKKNNVYFNEINSMPGFTSISMYPMLFEQRGISYRKLIDRLIELALK